MRWVFFFLLFSIGLQAEKTALITGVAGQDGSYLAELLLSKGYTVHGIVRRNHSNVQHLIRKKSFHLHSCDLCDYEQIKAIIELVQPDELYHLAAQSDIKKSFEVPLMTSDITGLGVTRVLEACRELKLQVKIYISSSSELFGGSIPPFSEETPFHPKNPYAAAKLYGFWMGVIYREAYNMFVSNGIFFNHESPRRAETFVTRKITSQLAKILSGKEKILELGNLDTRRDWGFAPDYVESTWKILQMENPGDFVIGTGECHSVREFLEVAFAYGGITLYWEGSDLNEVGKVQSVEERWKTHIKPGQELIKINPKYYRPLELNTPIIAQNRVPWRSKITFDQLVKIMVDVDFEREGLFPRGEGIKALRESHPYIEKY